MLASATHPAHDLDRAPVSNLATLQFVTSPQNSSTARHVHILVTTMSSTLSLISISIALVLHPSTLTNIWTVLSVFLASCHYCPTRHVLLDLLALFFLNVPSFLLSSFTLFLFLPDLSHPSFSFFLTFLTLFSLPSFSSLHCLLLWLVVVLLLCAVMLCCCCCSPCDDGNTGHLCLSV